MRDRFAVVVLGPMGDLADLDGGKRVVDHSVRAQKTLHRGEVGCQLVVGREQGGRFDGERAAPNREVRPHMLMGDAGGVDDLGLGDLSPRAGDDEVGDGETDGERQAWKQTEEMGTGGRGFRDE